MTEPTYQFLALALVTMLLARWINHDRLGTVLTVVSIVLIIFALCVAPWGALRASITS